MDFREPRHDPGEATAADWIAPRLGAFGSVGGLAPGGYDRTILVSHTPPDHQGGGYRAGSWLLDPLAAVLAADTATPEKAWFAVWEGYGVDEAVRRGLELLPSFELPGRRYYLLTAGVTAAGAIALPVSGELWPPDLWWPEDRSWFVSTDTDLWWSYVSGSEATIAAVEAVLPDRTRTVTRDQTNFEVTPDRDASGQP